MKVTVHVNINDFQQRAIAWMENKNGKASLAVAKEWATAVLEEDIDNLVERYNAYLNKKDAVLAAIKAEQKKTSKYSYTPDFIKDLEEEL